MTRVVWTAEAIGDLDAVRVYIERDSPNYANVVCADIVSAVICDVKIRIRRVMPLAATRTQPERSLGKAPDHLAQTVGPCSGPLQLFERQLKNPIGGAKVKHLRMKVRTDPFAPIQKLPMAWIC